MLYRYLGGAVVVLLLLGGVYLKGYSNGKDKVQAELDAQRAVWQADFDKQKAETDRIQGEWDASKGRENEIKAKLQVVSLESAEFARGMRNYRTSLRALSEAPRPTGQPDPTTGITGSLERAEEAYYGACARDSERLGQFQAFYKALQDAQ